MAYVVEKNHASFYIIHKIPNRVSQRIFFDHSQSQMALDFLSLCMLLYPI